MLELELEQGTNIIFLVKLGKSGNEIREMLLQVYGDNVLKKTSSLLNAMVVFSNEVCSTFTAMSSRPLLSDHVSYVVYLHLS